RRSERVCRAHLAEDLGLSLDARVEPGGDAEEVTGRRVVAAAVEHAVRLGGEEGACALLDSGPGDVELGSVAGREADGLGVAASASIAARETQKVKNIEPLICGPSRLKTTG